MSRRFQTLAAVTCLKLSLLLFNIVFLATGLIFLIFGLWMKLSLHYLFELSTDYTNAVPYIFIFTGSAILIYGILVCVCTVRAQPKLLYIFGIFIIIIFISEMVAVVSSYVYRGKIEDSFKVGLNNNIFSYENGRLRDRNVDMIQKYLRCCGVEEYTDWYAKWENQSVPQSCCKNPQDCHFAPVENDLEIYSQGCYVKVVDFINKNLGILLGGALGLGAFQLLGAMIACCLAKQVNKAKYEPIA